MPSTIRITNRMPIPLLTLRSMSYSFSASSLASAGGGIAWFG
jgi:hypothetical protein